MLIGVVSILMGSVKQTAYPIEELAVCLLDLKVPDLFVWDGLG